MPLRTPTGGQTYMATSHHIAPGARAQVCGGPADRAAAELCGGGRAVPCQRGRQRGGRARAAGADAAGQLGLRDRRLPARRVPAVRPGAGAAWELAPAWEMAACTCCSHAACSSTRAPPQCEHRPCHAASCGAWEAVCLGTSGWLLPCTSCQDILAAGPGAAPLQLHACHPPAH